MRILIDLQACQTESRFRGIGRYSMALTKEIARQAVFHDVWLLLNKNLPHTIDTIAEEFIDLIPRDHIVTFRTPSPISNSADNFWRVRTAELLREAALVNLRPDIVYITSLFEGWNEDAVTSVGLVESTAKTAVTLYDLIPYLNQETYLVDLQTRNFYLRKIETLKSADLHLAISEYARQECIDSLDIPPTRIVNISTAANDVFRRVELNNQESKALLRQYRISKPFIMYTGGFDIRKNLSGLFEAYSLLPAHLRDCYQLLVAGKTSDPVDHWLKN